MHTSTKAVTRLTDEIYPETSVQPAQIPAVQEPLCIYIAGYGRSGSTLLDALLGNHEQIFGAGELSYLFKELRLHARCSCHKGLNQCEYWKDVLSSITHADFQNTNNSEVLERLTREVESLQPALPRKKLRESYSHLWREVFSEISRVTGKNIIVDSSKCTRKTWNRPILLSKACGLDVKVIHLVRNPRAVMWSVGRGSNRLLEAGKPAHLFGGMLRGLLGWLFSNLCVEYIKLRLAPQNVLLLQYEDLVTDSAAQLERISNFLDIPLAQLTFVETNKTFQTGHGIAGNRLRRQGTIQVKSDDEWKHSLPNSAYLLSLLAWPLAGKYGYPIRWQGNAVTPSKW